MKKTLALLSLLSLFLLCTACGIQEMKEDETTETEASNYVIEDAVHWPTLNEALLPFDSVRAYNAELETLHQKLSEAGEAHGNVSYGSGWVVNGDWLSLSLSYNMNTNTELTTYLAYHINIKTGETASTEEICKQAGFTAEELLAQVKMEREAYLQYCNQKGLIPTQESGMELEDYMAEAVTLFQTAWEEGTVLVYPYQSRVQLNYPARRFDTRIPVMDGNVHMIPWSAGKTLPELAVNNAPEDVILAIVNHVTEEQKKAAQPVETLELSEMKEADSMLLLATRDNTSIQIETGELDMETFAFLPKETLLKKTLQLGESVYVSNVERPEGMPNTRILIQRDDLKAEYLLSYDGRFGGLALEYVIGTEK